eukprot:130151-Chlamydomonas_euryale.AAC.1
MSEDAHADDSVDHLEDFAADVDAEAAATLLGLQKSPSASVPSTSKASQAKTVQSAAKAKMTTKDGSKVRPDTHGSSRHASKFIARFAGGIPRMLPRLDMPVSTRAEKALFGELLPSYTSRSGS